MTDIEPLERRAMLSLADLAAARISGVAVQADSKIVVAGSIGDTGSVDFFLARFNANGSLDTTFGDGGTVTTDFGSDDTANDVSIDSQGRIVAAGGGGLKHDFAVARYVPSGALDTSFSGGKRLIAFGGHDVANAVAIAPDDKVVLVGHRWGENLSPLHVVPLARLNSNGSFDSTFDSDGTELLPITNEASYGFDDLADVAISGDGKLLITGAMGYGETGIALVGRLLPDGSVDESFNEGVHVFGDFDSWGTQIVEAAPDVFVVATTHVEIPFTNFVVSDNGSSIEELAGLPVPNDVWLGFATLLARAAKVIVTGWQADQYGRGDTRSIIARYISDGVSQYVPDRSFDGDGFIEVTPLLFYNASALDPLGRIVVVQTKYDGVIMARYQSNGQPDATFNGNGIFRSGSATVSGRVFNDTNADGIFDGDDTGISGFRVFLDEAPFNGVIDPGEFSRPVSGTGTYTFSSVPSGTYRVQVASREGWRQSSPALGYYEITIFAGQTARSLSFACADTIVIKGSVFMDANKNRVRDAAEAGLGGWYVYIDRNNDGVIDKHDTWTLTDANGNYRFFNLSAGTYTVRVVGNARYRQTAPVSGFHSVTLAAGGTISNRNFGEKRVA